MNKVMRIALVVFSLFSTSAWAEMVNINKASIEQIKSNLNGIGQKKAEAIIAYRTEHGAFKTIEEIKDVKGIGDAIFEKIKADLSLDSGLSDMAAVPATPDVGKEEGKTAAAPDKAVVEPAKVAAVPDKAAVEPAKAVKIEEKTNAVDEEAAVDILSSGKKDKS